MELLIILVFTSLSPYKCVMSEFIITIKIYLTIAEKKKKKRREASSRKPFLAWSYGGHQEYSIRLFSDSVDYWGYYVTKPWDIWWCHLQQFVMGYMVSVAAITLTWPVLLGEVVSCLPQKHMSSEQKLLQLKFELSLPVTYFVMLTVRSTLRLCK